MLKTSKNQPVYSIGVVSQLLDVHPETIRTWEKSGVIQPQRRSGKRAFSEMDVKRLEFIQRLTGEGLSVRAARYYLRLYPCWETEDCMDCVHSSTEAVGAKPCWKETVSYCEVTNGVDQCKSCSRNATPDEAENPSVVHESANIQAATSKAIGEHSEATKGDCHCSLNEVLTEANWADKIQSTLQSIVTNVAKEVRAKSCCLALFTPDKRGLRHMASYGLSEDYVSKCRASAEKNISEALEGNAKVIANATQDEEIQYGELAREEGIVSVLSVPVMLRNEALGILRVHTDQPRRFNEHDIYFVQTAASMGAKALEDAINDEGDASTAYDVFRQQLLEFEWGRWPAETNR